MEKLRSVGVFVRAVELRSFAAAASALQLTPSAVSKAIAGLEASLGVPLLTRSARGVVLTAEGTRFYERCRVIVGELEAAEREAAGARAAPRGRLRVTLHSSVARYRILPGLPRFLARHPDIQIEITLSPGARSIDAEGIDVGVFIGDPPESRLVARRIGEMQFLAVASPAYLARHGTPRTPEELAGHNALIYLRPNGRPHDDWVFERGGVTRTVIVKGNFCVNDGPALMEAAAAGEGIARPVSIAVERHVAAGALVPLLQDWYSEAPPVHVLHARGRGSVPKVRAFVDFLEAQLADLRPASPASVTRRRWPMHRS